MATLATFPISGAVLGVDIGYAATKRTTGVCLATWTREHMQFVVDRVPTDASERVATLRLLVGRHKLLAVGLDAPIRGALDVIDEYRLAERMLSRRLPAFIGKPGQSSSGNGVKLNVAANEVARSVIELGVLQRSRHAAKIHELALFEAFPTTFMGVMLDEGRVPSHGARSDTYFEHLLGPSSSTPPLPASDRIGGLVRRLAPGRKLSPAHFGGETDHEHRAAIMCAVSALCVVARQYVAVGEPNGGYIILPPRASKGRPGLQPWAWELLVQNQREAGEPAIVEEGGGE